jgi:hypothetical protein
MTAAEITELVLQILAQAGIQVPRKG